MKAIRNFFARLATTLSQQGKPSSELADIEVRISKVRIEPGDMLVITTEQRLTMQQREQIKASVRRAMPDMKAMVLDGGLRLSVLSQGAGGGSKV